MISGAERRNLRKAWFGRGRGATRGEQNMGVATATDFDSLKPRRNAFRHAVLDCVMRDASKLPKPRRATSVSFSRDMSSVPKRRPAVTSAAGFASPETRRGGFRRRAPGICPKRKCTGTFFAKESRNDGALNFFQFPCRINLNGVEILNLGNKGFCPFQ